MTPRKKFDAVIEGIRTSTDVVSRLLWISFGLLVAVSLGTSDSEPGKAAQAFGIGAAYASETAEKHPSAKPEGGEMTEVCLFLGRRSGDRWRPASLSISSQRYPVKPGDKVVVRQDALVYQSMDCKVIDAADFKADGISRSVLLAKADPRALEIAGPPIECPSIGGAKTVWVSVKIPTARLVSVPK